VAKFKDSSHLFRFAGLFVAGFLIFWISRGWVVPKSFGKYGHYRADAMTDVASHPIHYAGQDTCATCHADVMTTKMAGKHAGVHCEACHGPLEAHAEDPSVVPVLPETATLCARCHEASAARPKWFPQVATADHANGVPCETCHQPHTPAMTAEAAK
jgi:hypothetical protein